MFTHRTAIRWTALLGILTLLTAFIATHIMQFLRNPKEDMASYGAVPAFSLTERSGASFSGDNLQGRISIVDFIFTSCPGACPVMSTAMSALYRDYAQEERVQFVSISVDPETDTLPVLALYAEKYGVTDNRWVFLRGPIEEVKQLSKKGFMLAAGNLPMGHSTKFILVDTKGEIRGYYDSHDDESIRKLNKDIGILLQK